MLISGSIFMDATFYAQTTLQHRSLTVDKRPLCEITPEYAISGRAPTTRVPRAPETCSNELPPACFFAIEAAPPFMLNARDAQIRLSGTITADCRVGATSSQSRHYETVLGALLCAAAPT